MKKLLTLIMILTVSTSATYASFWKDIKNAFKQDVKATKQAVKADIENTKKEQAAEAAAKKKASLKEVNDRKAALNKELREVKADKTITETERTVKVKLLQKQIDITNKQIKDIQKW
jgi:hypothetical protein